MSDVSEFSKYGYRVERELGANRVGGRVTYLGMELSTQQKVVIKQFQFAVTASDWSNYDTYEREIQVLQGLENPGIPRYLDSFQTDNGFCIVQEYKEALSLATTRSYSSAQVRHIAVSVLEILVYLQNRIPSVIHRDIKPDNILIDSQDNVYLVDFGFARLGDGEVGVSSVVKGTLGFMPPEQIFNRQLTEASDLYGLGMTLICLLTGTKADEIGNLVDISYKIKFKHLVPKLSFQWLKWLEKMVEPRLKERFPNALSALEGIPTSSICPPEIHISQSMFDLSAKQIGEVLTQTITIKNPVSDTLLQGTWEIESRSSDHNPDSLEHSWIAIEPQTFANNHVICTLTVNSRKLMANKTYHRKLCLRTNTVLETHTFLLKIKTAPIPIQVEYIAHRPLILLFFASFVLMRINFGLIISVSSLAENIPLAFLSNAIGAVLGLEAAAWTLGTTSSSAGVAASGIAGGILGVATLLVSWFSLDTLLGDVRTVAFSTILGLAAGWILGISAGITAEKLLEGDSSKSLAVQLAVLTTASAVSFALAFALGFDNLIALLGLAITTFPLIVFLIHTPLRRSRLIARYRQRERQLIRL